MRLVRTKLLKTIQGRKGGGGTGLYGTVYPNNQSTNTSVCIEHM